MEALPSILGSSPRVWGQAFQHLALATGVPIIPTRVGTSRRNARNVQRYKDHPHACGDKNWEHLNQVLKLGSSPRVWGQAEMEALDAVPCRIIPTRVGTSITTTVYLMPGEDHPHACGDKSHQFEVFQRRLGSSPRVWGQVYYTPF